MASKELHYVAEAQRFLEEKGSGHLSLGDTALADSCKRVAEGLQNAIKFAVPDGALIIPGFRSSGAAVPDGARLPFRSVALAYTAVDRADYIATLPDGSRKSFGEVFGVDVDTFVSCPRRVLLLSEAETDGEIIITIICMWYTTQKPGPGWVLYPWAMTLYPHRKQNATHDVGSFWIIDGYEKYDTVRGKPFGEVQADLADEVGAVREFLAACSCSNVGHSTLEMSPLKKSLLQKSLKKRDLPFYEHKVLTVKTSTKNGSFGGTHASPRCHLRRGHIRRLPDGRNVWVNACVVGDKQKGFVSKDYRMSA